VDGSEVWFPFTFSKPLFGIPISVLERELDRWIFRVVPSPPNPRRPMR